MKCISFFILSSIISYGAFSQCSYGVSLSASPLPVNGFYPPGTTVTFNLNIGGYDELGQSYMHGIVLNFGKGWEINSIIDLQNPLSCSGNGYWDFYESDTSSLTQLVYGPGFYYEWSNAYYPDDGDPGDNEGDQNIGGFCTWTCRWRITAGDSGAFISSGSSINIYSDGVTGNWQDHTSCPGDIYSLSDLLGTSQCYALFSTSGNLVTGSPIHFNNTSPNIPADSVRWWFSDSTTYTTTNVHKVFSSPGSYNVCLAEYKGNCADTLCTQIAVADSLFYNYYSYPYFVSGRLFFDANHDGVKEDGEPYVTNAIVQINNGNYTQVTNDSGFFNINTGAGLHYLDISLPTSIGKNKISFTNLPDSIYIDTSSITIGNIGVYFDTVFAAVSSMLYSPFFSCVADSPLSLTLFNNGTVPLYGLIKILPAVYLDSVSVSPPFVIDSMMKDTILISFSNLPLFNNWNLFLRGTVQLNSGDSILCKVWINAHDSTNSYFAADSSGSNGITLCSFDPNGINVWPYYDDMPNYTLRGTDLVYTIHFTNTGNSPARTVILIDSLSPNLIPESVDVLQSTDSVFTYLDSNILKFAFFNIRLPDSAVNFSGSTGYVTFRMKYPVSIPGGTIIANFADVYFDNNSPIRTNTAISTIVDAIPTSANNIQENYLKIFPNPASDELYITGNKIRGSTIAIFNTLGEIMLKENDVTLDYQNTIGISSLPQGIYLIEVRSDKQNYVYKFVKE